MHSWRIVRVDPCSGRVLIYLPSEALHIPRSRSRTRTLLEHRRLCPIYIQTPCRRTWGDDVIIFDINTTDQYGTVTCWSTDTGFIGQSVSLTTSHALEITTDSGSVSPHPFVLKLYNSGYFH